MRMKAEVLLKLFDLVNESAEPEIALAAIEKLSDEDVANLLELFVAASEETGAPTSGLIKSAIRRLRKETGPFAAPNS